MPLPDPFPGLVLHYSYLWFDQGRQGLEEGTKDRPCVIVSAGTFPGGDLVVTVVPITHRAPQYDENSVEIPPITKRRLGMDHDTSWIVTTEVNRFCWPGADLRPVPNARPGTYTYGPLPPSLFLRVTAKLREQAENQRLQTTDR